MADQERHRRKSHQEQRPKHPPSLRGSWWTGRRKCRQRGRRLKKKSTTAVSITADRPIEPCEGSGCEGRGRIHTAEANYGTATGDDAQGAEILPRDGILGGGNEEATGEADQTSPGGLVDGVMGCVGLVRLQVELGAAARLALHGVGRCE